MAEETRASIVEVEAGAKELDLPAILRLRNAARNSATEHRALQNRLNGLQNDNISLEEKNLRRAVYNWILGRLDQADAALKNLPGPVSHLLRGGIAFDRGNFETAVTELQQAYDASGNQIKFGAELAGALRGAGRPAEAQ